ncbi:MAG: hypothetical protein JW874_02040 [Spirochaetales bacterium]|nr:hypothetical protein [Spirochaetales bacterium]
MISKVDYIFTIGYQGDTAIVDGKNRRQYGRMSAGELAGKGMYKPALCSALYDQNEEEQKMVLDLYNEKTGAAYPSVQELMKVFGIFTLTEQITRVKII